MDEHITKKNSTNSKSLRNFEGFFICGHIVTTSNHNSSRSGQL